MVLASLSRLPSTLLIKQKRLLPNSKDKKPFLLYIASQGFQSSISQWGTLSGNGKKSSGT